MNGHKTDQTEYVDIERWRIAIRDSRLHYEAQQKKLKERIDSISSELERIELELERIRDEEELIARTTRAYEERLEQPSKRSPLQGENLREILIIHFTNNNGIIRGRDASKMLEEIGYFSNRRSADGAIYTALGRPPFERLARGVYNINKNTPEWNRLRGKNGNKLDARLLAQLGKKQQLKTGLASMVKSMLVESPNLDIKQVTKQLQIRGWDFGGKNPISAVSAVFMRTALDRKRASNKTLPLPLRSTS